MQIRLNGEVCSASATDYATLRIEQGLSADTLIVNGRSHPWHTPIRDGDEVLMLASGEVPTPTIWRAIYDARYGQALMDRLQRGRVAICGLGGLGALVALELGRLGVGELLLIDCDRIDATNIARQHYTIDQIGQYKTDALAASLARSAPLTQIQTQTLRLDETNIAALLADWPLVCECVDRPETKALLTSIVLATCPDTILIGASGMAGYASGNAITAKRLMPRLYMVGDGESEGEEGIGLMAPRVGLCASAQATLAMRLLLGEPTP